MAAASLAQVFMKGVIKLEKLQPLAVKTYPVQRHWRNLTKEAAASWKNIVDVIVRDIMMVGLARKKNIQINKFRPLISKGTA